MKYMIYPHNGTTFNVIISVVLLQVKPKVLMKLCCK